MRPITKLVLIFLFLTTVVFSQEIWEYKPAMDIEFAEKDSLANPFLCAVDSTGNLWVISSTSTTLHAVNALYKAAPGDTVFTLIDDYSDDVDVHSSRGVTAIGNDIFVAVRTTTTDVASMFRYPNGNFAERIQYRTPTVSIPGYGTYIYGIAGTKDRYIYGGMIYGGVEIRVFDFSGKTSPVGQYVGLPNSPGGDPGGPSSTGEDAIRDVVTMPNGNYYDPETPIYTSRNSLSGGSTGGVTKWYGGRQDSLASNGCVSLEDADSFLKWTSYVPNGITLDSQGRLWAVGTDTSRRWVKVFEVSGNWATQVVELPSSTSKDIADPLGAPLGVPEDVALSPNEGIAYVIDTEARKCFTFQSNAVKVCDVRSAVASEFRLYPAFPNPFNPTTTISFDLPKASTVRLDIFDLKGRQIRTQTVNYTSSGRHAISLSAEGIPTGIYIYHVTTDFGRLSGKLAFLK
ncbi:MAG: T9SS type A sorting domain-containing protein [archaeon]